ncbi:MAG TPA: DUF3667 domain-containing protein [Albitalea sp.]|uniref:DUF3667 domain-containing protein n=1 Tax=Piscinibacter sp. TaxID=1903157 RepID=UPI002ED3041E
MGGELEAAGALTTAGLAAGEIEGAAGTRQPQLAAHATCRNCGATLAGPYCHACGQAAHLHHSLWHLGEEVLHGLLHFDAKGWRTLPLLIAQPGVLTRRYIDGQRARYVSPLSLFLFTMFLMFFVFSFNSVKTNAGELNEADRAEARAELVAAVAEAKAEVERSAAAASAARTGPPAAAAKADEALTWARRAQNITEAALAAFDASAHVAAAAGAASGAASDPLAAAWKTGTSQIEVHTGIPSLDQSIQRQAENPALALYKLKNAAYKFAFMLVPISLPFLWLMFVGRRGITMYDHAVFGLYSLSFMALLFSSVDLVAMAWSSGLLALLVMVAPPLHMFLQLREAYSLSTAGALWRTVALLAVAGTVFVMFLVFIVLVSAR